MILKSISAWNKLAYRETKEKLTGYEEANFDLVHDLKNILSDTTSYSELKKELTSLIGNRQRFLRNAKKTKHLFERNIPNFLE